MRVGPVEIARARTMRALGFPWRPRIGDWYVQHTGYCELVRSLEQAQQLGRNGDSFLPTWDDCRTWLAERGWGDPEMQDSQEAIGMWVRHEDGQLLRATGVSDLDCLYQVILTILLRTSRS